MKVFSLSLLLFAILETSITLVTSRELIALNEDTTGIERDLGGMKKKKKKKRKKKKKKKKKKVKVCGSRQHKPKLDIPETAVSLGFDTLVAALSAADLVDTLSGTGPFTVFAPTDDAFAALPDDLLGCLLLPESLGALTSILYYHVVLGEAYSCDLKNGQMITTVEGEDVEVYKKYKKSVPMINSANVVVPDVLATNGVIHAIDAVLVPPNFDVGAFLAACPGTVAVCGKEKEKPTLNIPETAVSLGFNTLVAAIIAADLLDAISGTGPLTVFAPTDDAFAALPDGLVQCLLLPQSLGALTTILLYHVVQGTAYSCNLKNEQMITTLNGEDVEVYKKYKNSVPMINSSNVVVPNVLATNGVIHAIDAVLVPPSVDVGAFLAACP